MGFEKALRAAEKSCKQLQLEYIGKWGYFISFLKIVRKENYF
jgi:hypothetical protein